MHDHEKREPVDVDMLRRMGYENRDISLGTITKFVIALFIFIGLTGIVTFGVYQVLVGNVWDQNKEWPLRTVGEIKSIPQPVLQARPVYDMTQFQKRENAKLEKQGFEPVPGMAESRIPENVLQAMERRYPVPKRAAGSSEAGPSGGATSTHDAAETSASEGTEAPAPAGAGHTGGGTHGETH